MDLRIKDRIYIPQLMSNQSTYMEYMLKQSILKKVEITNADKKAYNIVEDTEAGKVTWDSKKDEKVPLAVDFTKEESDYLKKCCESLSDSVYPDELWATVEKIYDDQKG